MNTDCFYFLHCIFLRNKERKCTVTVTDTKSQARTCLSSFCDMKSRWRYKRNCDSHYLHLCVCVCLFMCACVCVCNPSTYPSEDSQMLSSLLKSRLGSRSWGNSSSSLSSWSSAAPRLSSTPVMTGTSGSTGWDSRLCWLVEASVSSALSSLWVRLSAWASACGTVKHNRGELHADRVCT